jgi:hypothetical protein
VSKAPYRMSIPELTKLKIQIQELLDKDISDPMCHHGEHQFYLSKRRMGHSDYVLIIDI